MANKTISAEHFRYLLVGLALMASTSAGFAGGWLGAASRDAQDQMAAQEARQVILSESEVISQIVKDVGPSVVSISVTGERVGLFGPRQFTGAGTGFIISADGVVVTNRHVVPADAGTITVTLADGTELYDVSVIGRTGEGDPLDIAFLRINHFAGHELRPVRLGNSADVRIGAKVVAIGNALGRFQNTVTSGIISGFGRNIVAGDEGGADSLQNLFQTDAAINRGNSGGPLVNINGEVIGVTTAVAARAENIGFAIPIDDIKGLIATVLETGELARPYLGVRYIQLNEGLARQLGLGVSHGAYLSPSAASPAVLAGSPAAKAGLREGDVILKVNGEKVDEVRSLASLIGRQRVGTEVTLLVLRDGREQEIRVTLERMPE